MKLGNLFRELSFNEFSNLSLSNEGDGTIIEAQQGKIISAVNSALLKLHSRFRLIEKELILQSLDWKAVYPLRIEHAISNSSSNELKWIIDTPNKPFTGDLIHVIGVTNEVGATLPINDPNASASVFLPQPDTIQITHPGYSQVFFVQYKANHPELALTGADILNQEVQVPLALKAALRYKIAAEIFAPMAGQEYSLRVQSLEAAYESACLEIEMNSLLGINEMTSNTKLCQRGFP